MKKSKETCERLRRYYRSMESYRKGHATQLINAFRREGFLTEKQVAYAEKIIREVLDRKDPFVDGETDRRKRPWTEQEGKFFEKEYERPKRVVRLDTNSDAYKTFKESVDSILKPSDDA